MARLRVGDIEIDGTNVTIGGVPQAPVDPRGGVSVSITTTSTTVGGRAQATTLARQSPTTLATPNPTALATRPAPAGLEGLADLPVGDTVLFGGGTALIAVAIALMAATAAATGSWALFPGLGAIVVGFLRRRAVALRAARQERERARDLGGHAEALRALLTDHNQDQTIEWIVSKSGLPEPTVVRTLAFMRARQEVSEDLNVDTGEWYYVANRALPAPRDLDDRLAALTTTEQGDLER